MQSFLNGIFWGLILAVMTGPILFALIQAGVERGFRAGIAVGVGIWISDLLFIASVFWGVNYVINLTNWDGFKLTLGIVGGVILILFGLGTMVSKPPNLNLKQSRTAKSKTYLSLWTKGFIINTMNPFTFFFWISMMSAEATKDNYSSQNALLFFFGIFFMIVLSDSIKVYSAKHLSKYLKSSHILKLRRVSGAALMIFGIVLMVRVLVG